MSEGSWVENDLDLAQMQKEAQREAYVEFMRCHKSYAPQEDPPGAMDYEFRKLREQLRAEHREQGLRYMPPEDLLKREAM